MEGFSSCGDRGLLSSCNLPASHCSGLSLLRSTGSGHTGRLGAHSEARGTQGGSGHTGFSSCSLPALGLISGVVVLGLNCPYCTRNPPGPGMDPGSPALAGGFLTTGPSGRSLTLFLVYFYLPATSAGTLPIFSTT